MAIDYGERARALVGVRFRPQGRCAEGLDCVGLVCRVFDLPSATARRDYSLRGDHRAELEQGLGKLLRRVSRRALRPGDVMLLEVNAEQFHLGIRTAAGFVHAHAGIGRVVETPGVPQWEIAGVYRMRTPKRSR